MTARLPLAAGLSLAALTGLAVARQQPPASQPPASAPAVAPVVTALPTHEGFVHLPAAAVVPAPVPAQDTIDGLLDKLEELRKQKAALEDAERRLMDQLRTRDAALSERLRRLGVRPGPAQPEPVTGPLPPDRTPTLPPPWGTGS